MVMIIARILMRAIYIILMSLKYRSKRLIIAIGIMVVYDCEVDVVKYS